MSALGSGAPAEGAAVFDVSPLTSTLVSSILAVVCNLFPPVMEKCVYSIRCEQILLRFVFLQECHDFYAPTKLIFGALTFFPAKAALAGERLLAEGFLTPNTLPLLTMLTGFR